MADRARVRCGANRYENYECYEYWEERALHVMVRFSSAEAMEDMDLGKMIILSSCVVSPVSAIL